MADEQKGLPEGYTKHEGGDCPVDPTWYVDCIIRTSEGLGHSGPQRASMHEWNWEGHSDGLGAVVGYREASPSELGIDLNARWPE